MGGKEDGTNSVITKGIVEVYNIPEWEPVHTILYYLFIFLRHVGYNVDLAIGEVFNTRDA